MRSTAALNFNYTSSIAYPIDIISGIDAISTIGDALDLVHGSRAMIVCGPNTLRSGVTERVKDALGAQYAGTFSNVGQHVPADTMAEAAALARELKPDVIVSVGGGSAHDTSKALAMMIAGGGDINEYDRFSDSHAGHDLPELMPIIAVPTTIACAEISPGGGGTVTDRELGRKWAFTSKPGRRVVVVDGMALATAPVRILLSTALSQFRIAVECVCGPAHTEIGDALALHGLRTLMRVLPACAERDPAVLVDAKVAACLPSLARFHSAGSSGISTAICHQAGGLYDALHGEVHGIMLPHTMRFNLAATASRQALIAEALGVDVANQSDEDSGRAAADAITKLCLSLGNPTTLREVGVPEEGIRVIAEATMNFESGVKTNPTPITDVEQIAGIVRAAW